MFRSIVNLLPMFVCLVLTLEMAQLQFVRPVRARRWLMAWGGVATLLYFCHAAYFFGDRADAVLLDSLYSACNLAVYPLFLFFVSEVTDVRPLSRNPRVLAATVGIPVVAGVACAALYGMMSAGERASFVGGWLYGGDSLMDTSHVVAQIWLHHAFKLVFAVEVVIVLFAVPPRIRRYAVLMERYRAESDSEVLRTIYIVIAVIVAVGLLSTVANVVGRHVFVGTLWLALPSVSFSVLLFMLGSLGMHVSLAVTDLDITPQEAEPETLEEDRAAISEVKEEILLERLLRLEGEGVFFLTTDVKLEDVARKVGTNRTYLLHILHKYKKMNFSEYINRRRIAYAEFLFATQPKLKNSEVATRSGFNSSSSFYRNLKLYGGTVEPYSEPPCQADEELLQPDAATENGLEQHESEAAEIQQET